VHCSEEQLLSYLDGELSVLVRFRVRAHVQRCWRCRARLAAYDREILSLTEAVNQWSHPPADWKGKAKARLNEQLARVECSLQQRQSYRHDWKIIGAIAGCGAAIICGVLATSRPKPNDFDPHDAIAKAALAENALFRPAVRETVAIAIEQTRPNRVVRRGRLEAISDPATGRYTADYRGEDGLLKQALWKPGPQSEFIYQPAKSRAVGKRPAIHKEQLLANIADARLEPDQLEAAFLQWLENRSWRPISLTAGLAIWARQDGTFLRLDKISGSDGITFLRLTATRIARQQVVAIWTLDLEANSYRPRLETIRFQDHDREIEIRLAATTIREIPEAALREISFRPAASFSGVPHLPSAISPSMPSVPQPHSGLFPNQTDDIAGIVESLYALQQAGIWADSGVEISETPLGVVVRNRSNASPVPQEFVAKGANLSEALSSLADIREFIPPVTSNATGGNENQIADMRRHFTALEFLALKFGIPDGPPLSETSQKHLQNMFREHVVRLDRDLEIFAEQHHLKYTETHEAEATFGTGGSMADRLRQFARTIETLNNPDSAHVLQNLHSELKTIEVEYNRGILHSRFR
jgi:hypothetical protein